MFTFSNMRYYCIYIFVIAIRKLYTYGLFSQTTKHFTTQVQRHCQPVWNVIYYNFSFLSQTILGVILQSPRFFPLIGDDFSTDPPKQIETRSALVKRGGNRANGNYITTIIGDTVGLWSTENDGGGDQGHEISIILHTHAHTSAKVCIVTRAPFIYWIPTTTGAKYNNNNNNKQCT